MKTFKEIIAGKTFSRWRAADKQMRQLHNVVGQVCDGYGISPDSCHIDRIVNGELRLYAVSAAATVRIRQILPTLRDALNRAGHPVDKIRVLTFKIPD